MESNKQATSTRKIKNKIKRIIGSFPGRVPHIIFSLYHTFLPTSDIAYTIPLEKLQVVKINKSKLFYPSNKDSMRINIPELENYEKYFQIERGETVLDIGAAVGEFSTRAAKNTGYNGKVLAFEPDPVNYKHLKKNITYNSLENVETFKKAAWSEKGTHSLYKSNHINAHSLLKEGSQGLKKTNIKKEVIVNCIEMDSFLEKRNLFNVDFIKMDIEGAELKALDGMNKTLKKASKIVIESHFGKNNEEIKNKLNSLGFEVIIEDVGTHDIIYGFKEK